MILASINHKGHRTIRRTIEDLYNKEDYDTIIIDSPPSLEKIASEIIQTSHMVLIPITPTGGNDIWSTEQIAEEIEHISATKGKKIPSYFIVNRLQPNLKVHQMFQEALKAHSKEYEIGMMKSKLHLRTVYGLANLQGRGVYEMNDKKAKTEMVNLVNEIQDNFEQI